MPCLIRNKTQKNTGYNIGGNMSLITNRDSLSSNEEGLRGPNDNERCGTASEAGSVSPLSPCRKTEALSRDEDLDAMTTMPSLIPTRLTIHPYSTLAESLRCGQRHAFDHGFDRV